MVFELGGAAGEDAIDDVGDEVFGEAHEVVEVGEGHFGLDHPELGEVAAGLGFFGAEGGAEGVDLAEGEGGALDVELAGLGEVGLVAEVVDLEEGAGAFAGGGGEDGRVGEDEAVVVEVVAGGFDDFGADAEDGGLARGADPEVAVLHEEVGAMLFEGDGVGIVFGDALDDLDVLDVELVTAGGAFVGADFAGDDDGGFVGEAFDGLEDLGRDGGFGDDALDGAGAVAEDGKEQLAALAQVVEPAVQGDGLAFVLADAGDGGKGRFCHCRCFRICVRP